MKQVLSQRQDLQRPDGELAVIAVAICKLHAIVLLPRGSNSVAESRRSLPRVWRGWDKCQPCRAAGAVPKIDAEASHSIVRIAVYIVFSPSLGKYYTGISKFRKKRSRQHQSEKRSWTSRASDWAQVFSQDFSSYAEARAFERKIKARGARRYLEDLKRFA